MANFGYETIGASITDIKNIIRGSLFTILEDGTANSITCALKTTDAWRGYVKCAIYLHSDLSLVAITERRTITLTTTATWYLFNIIGTVNLVASSEYVLVAWASAHSGKVRLMYSTGVANQGHKDSKAFDSFPDPLVPSHETRKCSVYCTYSPVVTTKFIGDGLVGYTT